MSSLVALAAAVLPAGLLLWYIWEKDPQKEPTEWLVKTVMYGAVVCFPVASLEVVIEALLFGVDGESSGLLGAAINAFFVAALPEESFKLLALWLVLRKNPYFDEHFDGIVYAVCVGLGFAAVENVFYVLGSEDWVPVAITRALLAVPGHYAFAVLMGYYYSVYHFVDHSPRAAALVLVVPFLAHGIYDAIALSGAVDPYIGGASFAILIFFCIKMHKKAYAKILAQIDKDNYQRNYQS